MASQSTDYDEVKTEMLRLGIWREPSDELPILVVGDPDTRTVFYAQKEPKLAARASYNSDNEFRIIYDRLTVGRNPTKLVQASIPKVNN